MSSMRIYLVFAALALGLGAAAGGQAETAWDKDLALYLPLSADLNDHSAAQLPVEVVGRVTVGPDGAEFPGGIGWKHPTLR